MNKKNLTIKETFTLALQHHEKSNLQSAEQLYKQILEIEKTEKNSFADFDKEWIHLLVEVVESTSAQFILEQWFQDYR